MHNLVVENDAMRDLLGEIDWLSQHTALPRSVASMLTKVLFAPATLSCFVLC
jgi:hypothetical protein